ncbi:hypothetical protein MKW94_027281 [Papaver nudicaule]|uniref:Uncharacterized protein n=2 Tax=Papaver nudicaule TaxID=74823 RepID=A0AA41VS37_PAPNU|nr:hypothetical protein [Papaver nudicaule]
MINKRSNQKKKNQSGCCFITLVPFSYSLYLALCLKTLISYSTNGFGRFWGGLQHTPATPCLRRRFHAQKYFLKVQKNGTIAHVPPPRPKRKAVHPYPHKASRNAFEPLPGSEDYPSILSSFVTGNSIWDETSVLLSSASNENELSPDDYTVIQGDGDDTGLKEVVSIGSSGIGFMGSSSRIPDIPKQVIPDFAEVYGFIGSVFDPDTNGHMQKLKDMDPINFETVLLLMRNLTLNLSNPEFGTMRNALSSYDADTEAGETDVGDVAMGSSEDHLSC